MVDALCVSLPVAEHEQPRPEIRLDQLDEPDGDRSSTHRGRLRAALRGTHGCPRSAPGRARCDSAATAGSRSASCVGPPRFLDATRRRRSQAPGCARGRRSYDPAGLPSRSYANRMRLERVETYGILRTMGLTESVGQVRDRSTGERRLQFVGEHPLPANLARRAHARAFGCGSVAPSRTSRLPGASARAAPGPAWPCAPAPGQNASTVGSRCVPAGYKIGRVAQPELDVDGRGDP